MVEGSFVASCVVDAWCPICGVKMSVEIVGGVSVFRCVKHGVMKCYLDHDPFALEAVARHCDGLGIEDLEAGAKVTDAVAGASFNDSGAS